MSPARVPPRTLARVFWRCLFLQAAWNRRGMQNLGFAYAIEPALAALYPEPGRRREALERHLQFFNCHPFMAAAIVGGAIHHEERVAAGEEPPGAAIRYKTTLQGPLAALGDGFFWTALRPFCGALGAAGALVVGVPAIVAAVLLYNVIHFSLRLGLFRAAYRGGDAVVPVIARLGLPLAADRLRAAGVALCGVAAAIVVLRGAGAAGAAAGIVAALVAGTGYAALVRGARLLPTAYVAALAGIAVAVAGHLHWSS
ncbi:MULTISPECIES: PTS system mannose/fructose/sorbose family transporter subunit IID [Anaeromyxobacter]|uniref:PTS system mannose/fructose/sorbose family transporter subunit IID n=1 Tax=Anaeromyxobacter TaxID=161492 RepID=UPI0027DFF666|nr:MULTISPECIES: PTS system mannose/fructose/sorbose family transporter subunit IID [unclassified Anaeromyxobacter]